MTCQFLWWRRIATIQQMHVAAARSISWYSSDWLQLFPLSVIYNTDQHEGRSLHRRRSSFLLEGHVDPILLSRLLCTNTTPRVQIQLLPSGTQRSFSDIKPKGMS